MEEVKIIVKYVGLFILVLSYVVLSMEIHFTATDPIYQRNKKKWVIALSILLDILNGAFWMIMLIRILIWAWS